MITSFITSPKKDLVSYKNMNTLLQHLEKETNFTETENGALTNKTTFSPLIDFFGLGGSLREKDEQEILNLFSKAYATDSLIALKILFYFRDCRGGQGERKTFRAILKWLGNNYPDTVSVNLEAIPEFGRWDDLFCLEGTKVWEYVVGMLNREFNQMLQQNTKSLACKWFPSINTSSKETRRLAKVLCKCFGVSEKQYRQALSKTRESIKLVERDMCGNKWKEINYSAVPSKASLLYKDAFTRHDEKRYQQFISDVKSGKTKINALVTYPYEIVEKILYKNDNSETLGVIWNSLPNYLEGNSHNGIVVADVSGSMKGRPMAVSISLALYFAERNHGFFANHFITFSERPSLEKVVGNSIQEKVHNLSTSDWGMSTNLQSVFDLILNTAKNNQITQEEMPESIYIVSDMEFNKAISDNSKTNFGVIDQKYEESGYKRPNLIFWNVNARSNQAPITTDDKGTCLVSGCSPVILKTLLQKGEITAEQVMLDTINNERYSVVKL
jgi:hypothetical protein